MCIADSEWFFFLNIVKTSDDYQVHHIHTDTHVIIFINDNLLFQHRSGPNGFYLFELTKTVRTNERTWTGKKNQMKMKSENWRVTNATTRPEDMRVECCPMLLRPYMLHNVQVVQETHEKPSKINDQHIWHFQITFLHAIAMFNGHHQAEHTSELIWISFFFGFAFFLLVFIHKCRHACPHCAHDQYRRRFSVATTRLIRSQVHLLNGF